MRGSCPSPTTGEALFRQRQGQLNLSCAQCHDDNAGKHLAAAPIPQGHPTGYPVYRLEWQGMGSLQRRLRNCLIGMRAEPYAYGRAGICRARALLDEARRRHEARRAGGAAVGTEERSLAALGMTILL